MHKQIAKGKLCIEQVLCDKRERWDLVGGGREVLRARGRGHVDIYGRVM